MATPVIYRSPQDVGIKITAGADDFGMLGRPFAVTFHHSAGPRAPTKKRAQELHRAYQAQHVNQGYGDIGYHFSMDDYGRFYQLRPVRYKGAHTKKHNSGNIGIMVHGNYDRDGVNGAQRASLKWLFQGGFLILTGVPEDELRLVRGHDEWPDNSTACPGKSLMWQLVKLRNTEFR